jgi:hypothetical protein
MSLQNTGVTPDATIACALGFRANGAARARL